MEIVYLLLLLGSFVCFCVATASFPQRFNLVALGLALWVLVPLIHVIKTL